MTMAVIERQRNIVDFTLSSLWKRKGRNMSLTAVWTFLIFITASVMFFTRSMEREASIVLRNAPEIILQRLVGGRHSPIPANFIESVKAVEGVKSVQSRLWGYYYDALSGANLTLMVNDDLKDQAGNIVIGRGVARRSAAVIGNQVIRKNDLLPFKAYDGSALMLKVGGILSHGSELLTADLVLVSKQDFRKIFGVSEDYSTDLVVGTTNAVELSTVVAGINRIRPDIRIVLREDVRRTYETAFDWHHGLFWVMLTGVFLAVIILAWGKATGLSAEEKREIGILRAVGWQTSDILFMKAWEGVIVSLSAFLIGTLSAYLHVFVASAALFQPVLKGWSVLYPRFTPTPFINVRQLVALFFLSVIPCVAATLLPSWKPARVAPDAAMRT